LASALHGRTTETKIESAAAATKIVSKGETWQRNRTKTESGLQSNEVTEQPVCVERRTKNQQGEGVAEGTDGKTPVQAK
jgi:hypothetical protein